MSHPFGDLLVQSLHRKHGLSQSKLAAGILQSPSIITEMCQGKRLTGPQARERVVAIIGWLQQQAALETVTEANALLSAAGMSSLRESEPNEHTLLRQLRQQTHSQPLSPFPPPVAPARPTNLPTPLTSFVGRGQELAEVARSVAAHRLVTLIGAGGIGKSRLAIEVARRLLEQDRLSPPAFPAGVWFVALQAVGSPDRMLSAIADAIQCPPPGSTDVREHLLAYLHTRQIFLVLDNFEHLRSGADLLLAILTAAPQAKLLVTSREALNLEQEWRYPLNGLPLHTKDDTGEAAQSSAAGLFVERARRVFPAFDSAAERDAVQRICQQVEGIPLAIELAAIWTRVLSCTAIADEIVRNLAFLTSNMNNSPDRQRSMQAVFAHSWQLLSQEEQQVFARLSVFRGGFQRHAAEQVAGATLPILTALVDKSLLRWEAGDRYRMHELLRQYAAQRLEESAAEAADVQARHCTYYADFLDQRTAEVNGQHMRQVLAEIGTDLENARAAWQYALHHARIAEIERAAHTLYMFHDNRSRYREGAELFEQAVQQLNKLLGKHTPTPDIGPALSAVLVYLGHLSFRLGELQRARVLLERSQAILTHLSISPRPASFSDPLVALGILANIVGDYGEAARLGEEARRRADAQDDPGNLMAAWYVLTNAAFGRGRYAEASQCAAHACQLAEQLHERWFMAYLVADLGNIARAVGDYTEAVRQYQIGYAIREEFGDPEGIAVALVHLGQVSLLQAEPETARTQFQHSLAIYREIGDRGGIATALHGLGMAAVAVGAQNEAAQHLHEALQIGAAMGYTSRVHAILLSVAELFVFIGEPLWAARLVVSILHDPASDRETYDSANTLLPRCTALLSPEQVAAATVGPQTIDLPAVFAALRVVSGGAAVSSITQAVQSVGA